MRPKNSLLESKKTPDIDKKSRPLAKAAVAGIGFFSPGIAMKSGGCGGITGIFSSCQRTSQNTENIDRLANSLDSFNNYVKEISSQTDEKFFLVADGIEKNLQSSKRKARKPEQRLETS